MSLHFKKICSIIDKLFFDLDFEISEQSEPKKFELSQRLKNHYFFDQSNHDAASMLKKIDSQSSCVDSQNVTPETSQSQRVERDEFKKPRKRVRL